MDRDLTDARPTRRDATLAIATACAWPGLAVAQPSGAAARASPPAPAGAATGFGLPEQASRSILAVGTNTAQAFEPRRATMYHMAGVVGAWGTASRIVLRGAQGAATDLLYVIGPAGGHGDSGWDGMLVWRASTRALELYVPSLRPDDPLPHGDFDTLNGEEADGRPASQHPYQHLIGLDSDHPLGPAVMQLNGYAVGRGAIHVGQAHRFDFRRRTWQRYGDNPGNGAVYGVHATLHDTRRQRFVKFPSSNGSDWYWIGDRGDAEAARWTVATQPARSFAEWSSTHTATAIYDPVRDLYLAHAHLHQLRAVRAAEAGTAVWRRIRFGGDPLPEVLVRGAHDSLGSMMGGGLQYRPEADQFVIADTATQPARAVFFITPPPPAEDPFDRPWRVERRVFSGASAYAPRTADRAAFNRFLYYAEIDSLLVLPSHAAPLERWKF